MIINKVTRFDDVTNESVTTILKENLDGTLQSIELRRPRFSYEQEHLHTKRNVQIKSQSNVSSMA